MFELVDVAYGNCLCRGMCAVVWIVVLYFVRALRFQWLLRVVVCAVCLLFVYQTTVLSLPCTAGSSRSVP